MSASETVCLVQYQGEVPAHRHDDDVGWDAKAGEDRPPQSGTVTFDNYEEGDGFTAQPVIAAYTGDRVDALNRIAVTHEFHPGEWSTFSFTVTAGVSYRIALDEDDPFGYGQRHRLNCCQS